MQSFRGKTAVITGAASGIGRAIAEKCAAEGMRLALADVESAALEEAAEAMRAAGAEVLAVQTDVSDFAQVMRLADAAYERFGRVDLLFNNAGVGAAGPVWQAEITDWQWVMGVNLWGVIHGVKAFVPRMMAEDSECWVVNTSSIAGIITGPGMGVYNLTKHGVVALSETLFYDLEEIDSKVRVAVLCPAWVKTRILESARNRPANLPDGPMPKELPKWMEQRRQAIEGGLEASLVADRVFEAIREGRFYIFTHPEAVPLVQARFAGILDAKTPINPVAAAQKLFKMQEQDAN